MDEVAAVAPPILFHFTEQHGLDGSRSYDSNPAWIIPLHNDRPIGGVDELVNFIEDICTTQDGAIAKLNLVCHGKADGIWIGKDWVSHVGAPRWLPILERLAPRFVPGAGVTVHSAEGGTDRHLIAMLEQAWPGTRIEGYLDPYDRYVFLRRDEQGKRVCRRRLAGIYNVVDEC